jgi:hypothetical protein
MKDWIGLSYLMIPVPALIYLICRAVLTHLEFDKAIKSRTISTQTLMLGIEIQAIISLGYSYNFILNSTLAIF